MTHDFSPLNDFEISLVQAQRGEIEVAQVLAHLASADLALPSAGAVQADGAGFQPLLFSKDGVPMLACFSAKERMADFVDMTPFCLVLKGRALLRTMPVGHGLVVNPGQRVGFDVSPEGIARMVVDLALASGPPGLT